MPDSYIPSRLDRALFGAPFIVIDADNAAHHIAHDVDEAACILNTDVAARAIVGTLAQPMLAIDIDPEDTGATSEAGDAVAEQLVLWADHYGLPWLRRASGRPGHAHLVIKTPPCLRSELQLVIRKIAARQNVSATLRSTLRLTSSPHRHDLPSPIQNCTLTTADALRQATSRPARSSRATRRRGGTGRSRSESEYGHALALARAGHTTAHAWSFANLAGTKAREIGERAWRRWFWAPATTIAAAESNINEQQAWDRFYRASPTQAAYLGRDAWRRDRWLPALREAEERRPRRRRLGFDRGDDGKRYSPPRLARQVQAELQTALDERLARASVRGDTIGGVRVSSLRAALDALAHAIATTQGSISVRRWSEHSHLDTKTVRRARDAALKLGIIKRVHHYEGGRTDCDAFALVVATESRSKITSTSPTLYTPSLGPANPLRLENQHQEDRLRWHLRPTRPSTGTQEFLTGSKCRVGDDKGHRLHAPTRHERFNRFQTTLAPKATMRIEVAYLPNLAVPSNRAALAAVDKQLRLRSGFDGRPPPGLIDIRGSE